MFDYLSVLYFYQTSMPKSMVERQKKENQLKKNNIIKWPDPQLSEKSASSVYKDLG